MERISCVIGIYGALHTIFQDGKQADSWIKRPNAAALFSGQTALHLMMGGQVTGLRAVRLYLDGQVEPDSPLQPDARCS
nr:MbcA/ParS/Xre antitoxin family protein [Arenimonas sp. SCN 70-307]